MIKTGKKIRVLIINLITLHFLKVKKLILEILHKV